MLGNIRNTRRRWLSLLAAAAFLVVVPTGKILAQPQATEASEWPPRTVRIIVPYGAGSTPDMVGRILAESLQARHPKSTFIVENKPGAAGNIGTDSVARALPDGATIGISLGGPLAINTLLFAKLPYNPDTDIAPITMLTQMPSILAVPETSPANDVASFIELLKSEAKGVSYGSIGAGSLSQLCMEALAQKAGAKMVHIPYASSPTAVTALIRGDAQSGCLPAISVTPQLPTGKLKALAVTTAKRSPFLPDLPTLKESGIDVQSDAWNALIAPGGTPDALIAKINTEVRASLAEPAVIEKLKIQLITPAPSTPEELRKRMKDEVTLWADVIRGAGIRIE